MQVRILLLLPICEYKKVLLCVTFPPMSNFAASSMVSGVVLAIWALLRIWDLSQWLTSPTPDVIFWEAGWNFIIFIVIIWYEIEETHISSVTTITM